MKPRHAQTAAAFLLLSAAIVYRLVTGLSGSHSAWMPNFSPMAAIALCGTIFLPKRFAVVVPLVALFVSDLALNAHYGVSLVSAEMLSRYLALGLIVALGWALRDRVRFGPVMLAAAGASTVFYVVTNTASWLILSPYAKSFGGWVQALTVGVPGYEPTWMFFRNSLVSDLLFTGVFFACFAVTRESATAPAAERLATA